MEHCLPPLHSLFTIRNSLFGFDQRRAVSGHFGSVSLLNGAEVFPGPQVAHPAEWPSPSVANLTEIGSGDPLRLKSPTALLPSANGFIQTSKGPSCQTRRAATPSES